MFGFMVGVGYRGVMNIRPFLIATIFLAVEHVSAAPKITSPSSPTTNSVSVGASLTLKVVATTSKPPLAFQWRLDGNELMGLTNSSVNFTNLQTSKTGTYTVAVSDEDGTNESNAMVLDVDPTFTKITSSPALSLGGSGGVAWGDFNNDGYLDLFVASNPINLFSNRTDGTFVKVPSSILPSGNSTVGGIWGDYDNDGYLDLFVGGAPLLYHNSNGTRFTQVATTALTKSGAFNLGAWADYDRDGNLDLFATLGFTKGANALFRNEGGSSFSKTTSTILSHDVPQFSQGAAWGDYDNDGWPDLFVANARDYNNGGAPQKSFLYHNLGNGSFEKITNSIIATTLGGFAAGIWGDYDNDGYLDLFVCGYANGSLPQKRYLFHNNRDGTFSMATNAGPITVESGYDQGCAWVDYDNDGWLDVFVASGGPGAFKDTLYRNNGDGTFSKVTRGSLVNDNGEGAGCAWGDFNNDGFQDLYVANFQNQTPEKNALYLNNGNSNAWVTIRCQGRVSNRSAIGTKVRVKTTIQGRETWQLREIASNGGYMSQTSLDACFGLGNATNIDLIQIEWPSGTVQTITNAIPRKFISVVEPSRIHAQLTPDCNSVQLTVQGGKGLVYELEQSSNLADWLPASTDTNVTGLLSYTNNLEASGIQRFYRARER